MYFEQDAALVREERTMECARRTAGVSERLEALAALALSVIAHGKIAGNKEHFLPVIMHEGRRGEDARIELEKPRARALLARLIQTALALTKGRRIEAAHKLGIGRNTITRKIQELGLD